MLYCQLLSQQKPCDNSLMDSNSHLQELQSSKNPLRFLGMQNGKPLPGGMLVAGPGAALPHPPGAEPGP